MKKFFLIAASIFSGGFLLCVLASDPKTEFLEKMNSSLTCGEFSLTTKIEDTPLQVSGTFEIQYNGYELKTEGITILSDFSSRWTIDNDSREVIVETDEIDNPEALLREYGAKPVFDSEGRLLRLDAKSADGTLSTIAISKISFSNPSNRLFAPDEKALESEGYIITDLRW